MRSVLQMHRRLLSLWLLPMSVAWVQGDTVPKQPLRSPAAVSGTVGGEAHDSYVIQARKGQAISVSISWRRAGEDHAEFSVSESADFYSSAPVAFETPA